MGNIERVPGRLRCALTAFALLLLAGCSTLPSPPVRMPQAVAEQASAGFLAELASASLSSSASSGFRLLPNPGHALDARVQLLRRATRSLDVQYYYIADDATGRGFLRELGDAAARGVQVRLLVDDLHTAALDPALRALARQPNLQVRLFNPFCCARAGIVGRFAASLFDIGRLNQRMHNKLLIADGVLAIGGGRNIVDEYFARNAGEEFLDLDTLMAGAIVPQLGAVFARYWNSTPARDALSLAGADDATAAPGAPLALALPLPPDLLGQSAVADEIVRGRLALAPGSAWAFADAPDKVLLRDDDYLEQSSVSSRVIAALDGAQREVLLSTPYFVPGKTGMNGMGNLRGQGVSIRVLTNSLASNDSVFAHAGYARYRRAMLALGVELYELRTANDLYANDSDDAAPMPHRAALFLSRLHAKTAVIDRSTVFVGSMNLDPRSSHHNTELGLLIESPEFAAQVARAFELATANGAWRVRLGADGRALEWVAQRRGVDSVLTREPQAGLAAWLQELLLGPLIPESLL